MTRKTTLPIFLTLVLIIAASFPVYTQTSASKTVSKSETVAFLIEQNKAANELIGAQKTRIADLETEVAAERENSASLGKSYETARSEISSLKQSNDALARAVSINENTIVLLQEDNAKQRDKAKKATKDKWKAYGIAAAFVAIKLLIP